MRPAVPRRNARPPIPVPGTAGRSPLADARPTVRRRSMIRPLVWVWPGGFPPNHDYVRRYWTAAIGAAAVADLLRVIQAARRRTAIKRPLTLGTLARAGLVVEKGARVFVRSTVPPVPTELVSRLSPRLKREVEQIERR